MELSKLIPDFNLSVKDRFYFLKEFGVRFFGYDFSEDFDHRAVAKFFSYLKNEKRIVQDPLTHVCVNGDCFNGGGMEKVIGRAFSEGDLYDLAGNVVERIGVNDNFNAEIRVIYNFPEGFSFPEEILEQNDEGQMFKGYGFVLPCLKGQKR